MLLQDGLTSSPLTIYDLPPELLARIALKLDITDRMAFMEVSEHFRLVADRWTDIDKLKAFAVVELYSNGKLKHYAWGKNILTNQFASYLTQLRCLELVMDCRQLTSQCLPSFRNLQELTLLNMFFSEHSSSLIDPKLLKGLLASPDLHSFRTKVLVFGPHTKKKFVCRLDEKYLKMMSWRIRSLSLSGIQMTPSSMNTISSYLPLIDTLSVDNLEDNPYDFPLFMRTVSTFKRLKNIEISKNYAMSMYKHDRYVAVEELGTHPHLETISLPSCDTRRQIEYFLFSLLPTVKNILFCGPKIFMSETSWQDVLWTMRPKQDLRIFIPRYSLIPTNLPLEISRKVSFTLLPDHDWTFQHLLDYIDTTL